MNSESTSKAKNNFVLITIVGFVVFLLLAGGIYKISTRSRINQIQNEMAQSLVTPTPAAKVNVVAVSAPVLPRYSKPVVGMDYSDFYSLCGQPDDIRSLETAKGKTLTYTYEHATDRSEKQCVGTFTLVNDRLSSIYRN